MLAETRFSALFCGQPMRMMASVLFYIARFET